MTRENTPDTPGENADSENEPTDFEAKLLGHPALVKPGNEVPAELRLENLSWSLIEEAFVPERKGYIDFPSNVREEIEATVENAGYKLVGYDRISLDVEPGEELHDLELGIVLTGHQPQGTGPFGTDDD